MSDDRSENPPASGEVAAERATPRPLERYEIGGRIGKGGMGVVMAAHDRQLGRDVAIKRMLGARPTASETARFLREAKIQGRLEHPAIVPVHELGEDESGRPYFVMKLLSGITLAELIREPDRMTLHQVLRGFADVCIAVAFAHARGIVHRDLKPDNVMFGEFGEVYVLDWGVSKVIGEADIDLAGPSPYRPAAETQAGTVIGTPGYIAPEQREGDRSIDGRADVYALGCMLFEILCGEPLYPPGMTAATDAHREDPRPSTRSGAKSVPPELDALCVSATSIDRDTRPSARELGDQVLRYLDGDRDLALRQKLARDHFEEAEAAFHNAATAEARRDAMRGASAAMALDPRLPGPAALITRLMLEPPAHTPAQVTEALLEEDARTAQAHAKASLAAILMALVFVPFQWWAAPSGSWAMAIYTTMLVVSAIVVGILVKVGRPWPGLLVIGNAIIVLVVAIVYSPLLIAPGLGAVLAMACVLTPRYTFVGSAVTVGALMILVVLGPVGLAELGVIPDSVSVSADGALFRVPAISDREGPAVLSAAMYSAALIIGATGMADLMRRRTREAQHRLQLQAWQLRQLVS
ncbi:MAG: serine/threonine-protein kinase [Kofleriaceae bacterium]